MRIVVAGGHGQIALRVERQLVGTGHTAVGLVRNPDHVDDVRATGAEALVLDLESAGVDDVAAALAGADAVLFAAGAGPGSGAPRKDTVDRGASVLLADAAEQAGVARFVQISSIGAGSPPPPGTDETFAAYLQAKTAAEDDLRRRDLAWTVLRPGGLTNAPGTGRVDLAPSVPRGQVPRDDVATVAAILLTTDHALHHTLALVSGDTPIPDAVARF
jgi:nucleoside-diphosphate-sugar epimerase